MQKLLVANRGEIALRVLRTAHEMGIKTVAVVSEVDQNSAVADFADEVYLLGPAPVTMSYLNVEAILKAAAETGADAIHPGYGFLSENAAFAKAVTDAGLTWVGPAAESIEIMGDKVQARVAAIDAGVPILAGTKGAVDPKSDLLAVAAEIGYPLLVKAAAGGGGRGIRLVEEENALLETVEIARTEAQAAFGSAEVYFERFVREGRHVEVQIFGDGENYVHFGTRDCSMQRRQQKVLEEAPAPNIPQHIIDKMHETAVELARKVQYTGAGTVEYLYDREREEVAFLEMNTRLQVEHPITEMITGFDLVREQLRVARGEKLGYKQEDISFDGHALEFRINAENPGMNFMPSPGDILKLNLAGGPGVRNDFGYRAGDVVSPFYDSLLGKIIVWGSTREESIKRAQRVLKESIVEGIHTTIPLMSKLVSLPEFQDVTHHTTYIQSLPNLLEDL